VRESSAERKLFLDQNLAEEAVLLPRGKGQPRDADGDCADDVGEGFGHIVGVSYAWFWVEASKVTVRRPNLATIPHSASGLHHNPHTQTD